MVTSRISSRLAVEWRRMSRVRMVVAIVFVVAFLSVLTGLVHLDRDPTGPLATIIPSAIHDTVGFSGSLTGFVMVGCAFGLRRGLRVAWYLTILLLPITALQGLLQSSPYSVPLVVLSVLAIPLLWNTRTRFRNRLSLSATQLAAGGALIGAQAYGTFGAFALREDFDGIETLLDAFYFTLITSSTVGYGDIVAQSEHTRLFTMSVVIFGVSSFGLAIGVLVGPAIQTRLQKTLGIMTESELELLEDHVIVLGCGDLTESIIDTLEDDDIEIVVIARDEVITDELTDRGISVIKGDPSDRIPLERAKLEFARAVVVATDFDADDALSILTTRQLNSEVRIVAAATDRENVSKLEQAGADTVISPAEIGGHLLVRSAMDDGNSFAVKDLFGDTEATNDSLRS